MPCLLGYERNRKGYYYGTRRRMHFYFNTFRDTIDRLVRPSFLDGLKEDPSR